MKPMKDNSDILQYLLIYHKNSVLFFSRHHSEGWPHHGRTFSVYLCPLSIIIDCTESPVHVLMLSIHAVCGLPRLRAPDTVPCIISFSRQLPGFLMM